MVEEEPPHFWDDAFVDPSVSHEATISSLFAAAAAAARCLRDDDITIHLKGWYYYYLVTGNYTTTL